MKFRETFSISTRALKRNRARTLLTILGVVIGISSVTVIISAGKSLEKFINNQISSFGSNFIQTEVRVPQGSGGATTQVQGVVITTLKEKDRQDFLDLPYIDKAYGAVITQDLISWKGEINKALIYGVSSEYIDIDATEIDYGRFFTEEEDNNLARVIVLGKKVKEDLFGASNPIDQNVKIKGLSYKVIGVAKERGAVFFFDMDDLVYIPVKTTQKLLMGINYLSAITSQLSDPSKEEETAEAMREILRENHDIDDPDRDDFEVMGIQETQDILGTVLGAITILLVVLASISLVVGGVGIMNIMYASVAERTFEIGLRKSVGASNSNVLKQFLMEAILVTFLGGIFGVLFGIGMTYLIFIVANYYGMDWPFSLSLIGIILAIGFSIAVGLIFGIYPAKKAADLNPIMALRKE